MMPLSCRNAQPVRFVIATLVAFAALAGSASAHSAFHEATPQPGSRIETSPGEIVLAFSEPLNRSLTQVQVVDVRTSRRVPSTLSIIARRRVIVRPDDGLVSPAAYRVDWHTVSTQDGHALEGSFGFGVRTAAIGGEQRLEQSPLARHGWLRVLVRGLFYGALLFVAGGLFTGLLLSRSGSPWGWLRVRGATDADLVERAIWRRSRRAGWVAALGAVAVGAVETIDAAGTLDGAAIHDYLLTSPAGLARLTAILATVAMAVLLGRRWRLASIAAGVALMAVAVGGHASSASPRLLAITTDWVHLAAGAIWAGGIAQIVAALGPELWRMAPGERRAIMLQVLPRFGTIALPAFVVVTIAGLLNAVIQLGDVRNLWATSYGLALTVKIGLVAALGAISYLHAMRLRPRVLADQAGPAGERRHWRLLCSEPALAGVVVTVAALLAVFPLPPRQLLEGVEAEAQAPSGTAVRSPAADELAVAEAAGPWIAAVWVRRDDRGLRGTVRLLDLNSKPVDARVRVGRAAQRGCGRGCVRFWEAPRRSVLRVDVRQAAKRYTAEVPVRHDPRRNALARALFERAEATLARANSFQIAERLSGGPGSLVTSEYRVRPPDRFAITLRSDHVAETINIASRRWSRIDRRRWDAEPRGDRVDTRDLLPWRGHAQQVRFLGTGRERGRRFADIALTDPGPLDKFGTPFWFRLRVERATGQVIGMRMIAAGHFMRQRYFAYDEPLSIQPPRG